MTVCGAVVTLPPILKKARMIYVLQTLLFIYIIITFMLEVVRRFSVPPSTCYDLKRGVI